MTSHPSHPPVSALRERMIEDMTVRGFGAKTRHDYVRHVRTFAAFIGRSPDTATAEEVRRFQLHQTETGVGAPSINSAVSALRFLFSVTLERPDLARRLTVVRQPRKLPLVLSAAGGRASARGGAGAEVQGGARHGLWRRAARRRGGRAQGRRRRQHAHDVAGRAGQGPQRSLCDALAPAARAVARLVAGGTPPRRDAAAGLAVSRAGPGQPADHTPAQPRRPRRRRGGRDQQAGDAAHAPPQLRHPPAGAGHRHPGDPGPAWATPSSTPPRSTPGSPPPRSAR